MQKIRNLNVKGDRYKFALYIFNKIYIKLNLFYIALILLKSKKENITPKIRKVIFFGLPSAWLLDFTITKCSSSKRKVLFYLFPGMQNVTPLHCWLRYNFMILWIFVEGSMDSILQIPPSNKINACHSY
jgi:hypothetical protein